MSLNLQGYLTSKEVAEKFGVTLKTVYQWAEIGLASEHYGRMRYFQKDVVAAFVPPRGRYQKRSK